MHPLLRTPKALLDAKKKRDSLAKMQREGWYRPKLSAAPETPSGQACEARYNTDRTNDNSHEKPSDLASAASDTGEAVRREDSDSRMNLAEKVTSEDTTDSIHRALAVSHALMEDYKPDLTHDPARRNRIQLQAEKIRRTMGERTLSASDIPAPNYERQEEIKRQRRLIIEAMNAS